MKNLIHEREDKLEAMPTKFTVDWRHRHQNRQHFKFTVDWAELAQGGEDWQKEICQLFATEFGEGEMEVEFAW